jgi:hypothetical protein
MLAEATSNRKRDFQASSVLFSSGHSGTRQTAFQLVRLVFVKVHHVSTYTWTGNQCGRLDGVS